MMNAKAASLVDAKMPLGQRMSAAFQSVAFLRWFVSRGYAQGVFWAIMICVVSVTNDLLMKWRLQKFGYPQKVLSKICGL